MEILKGFLGTRGSERERANESEKPGVDEDNDDDTYVPIRSLENENENEKEKEKGEEYRIDDIADSGGEEEEDTEITSYRDRRLVTIPSYSSNSTDLRRDGRDPRDSNPPTVPRQEFFSDSSWKDGGNDRASESRGSGKSTNVPKFVPGKTNIRDPNNNNNNDDYVGNKQKRKIQPEWEEDEGENAEGKMGPGWATFEDVYHDFERSDPSSLRDEMAPPYAPRLDNGEMVEMVGWERRKIRARSRLSKDKLKRFLELFAGFTARSNLDRLVTGPTRRFPGMERGSSPIQRPPPTPKREEGMPPLSPASPIKPMPPFPQSRVEPFLKDSKRMRSASVWLEEPDVLGSMELAPEVYSHVMKSFTMITMRFSDKMAGLTSFDPFINTNVLQVATLFAELCATNATLTDFFNPTRNTFNANAERLQGKIQGIMAGLGKFRWGGMDFVPEYSGATVRAGLGTIYTPFPTTSGGLLFPRYSN